MFNGFQAYQMQNPYLDRLNAMQQQTIPPAQITTVTGENGAKAYQMPPNSSILLLDETQPIVWLKKTDGAGYPTLEPYSITPYKQEKPIDTKSLEQRIIRLEEILNAKSDTAEAKQKSKHSSDADK